MAKTKKVTYQLDSAWWHDKRVLVTGGHGFVGKHVVSLLKKLKPASIKVPSSKEIDYRKQADCAAVVKECDVIIHLAANVGGIGYNQEFPGTLFFDNLMMGVHLMEEARKAKISKFVAVGTICAYPKFTPVPFREEDLWDGYPEETNAPYGLAKKMMLVQAQAYRQEFGFNAIYLLPVNMYGPGDNFDPRASHVIPALIKKFVDARETGSPTVTVWGTGTATREFLFVRDFAEAVLLATQHYNGAEPVNVGSSFEISIAELAKVIKEVTKFPGKIVFDSTKPDGQPRRKLDTSRATEFFGFTSSTTFQKGLAETVEWYEHTLPSKT